MAHMWRTYRRALGVSALGALTVLLPAGLAARGVFDSLPLRQERFAVLAQPVGRSNWKLLVLEQIKQRPLCWTKRADGLMDPTLNTFNFAGICSRYLDSNGYSLRSGGEDLGTRYRLNLRQKGNMLELQAGHGGSTTPISIGRAVIPARDRNGFVRLRLDEGWRLERRVYRGRTVSHVYFAHSEPVNRLLALAKSGDSRGSFARLGAPTAPTAPPRLASRRTGSPGQPIRLQVIPYGR